MAKQQTNNQFRKIRVYIRFFGLPLLLVIVAIVGWFFTPNDLSNFKSTLVGTLLSIGITLAAAEGFRKLAEYKRVKKTFGLLKLVTIPYLKNQSENLEATMKQYNDICSIEQSVLFFAQCSQLDKIATNFDKSWLQLMYSQDFLDAVNSDDHFNKIANAIFEVLLFIKQLSSQSANAQINLHNDFSKLTKEQQEEFINRAKQMRDGLKENIEKLSKYTGKLDEEILKSLNATGTNYSEFDR